MRALELRVADRLAVDIQPGPAKVVPTEGQARLQILVCAWPLWVRGCLPFGMELRGLHPRGLTHGPKVEDPPRANPAMGLQPGAPAAWSA